MPRASSVEVFSEAIKLLVVIAITYFGSTMIELVANNHKNSIVYEVRDKYKEEKLCMKDMLWGEARNTSYREKIAIAEVAINRSNSYKFPRTICEVVRQEKQYSYRNYLQDKSKIILPKKQDIIGKQDLKAYNEIEEIVNNKFKDGNIAKNIVIKEKVMYYHTKQTKPMWSKSKEFKSIVVDKKFKHRYYASMD